MKPAHFIESDPLAADENERWSLSWKPDGHCDHFTKEAILTHAPAASGVYGLYNFDCQIFIGESANIREVLLRLEGECDFNSQRLRPTGFSFELCPQASRKQKASALIARYRPALQTMTGADEIPVAPCEFAESRSAENDRRSETRADTQEFSIHAQAMRKPRPKWVRHTVLSAILVAAGVAAYFYFTPFDFAQIANRLRNKSSVSVSRAPGSRAKQTAKTSPRAEPAAKNNPAQAAKARGEVMPGETEDPVRLVNAAANDELDNQKSSFRETAGAANNRAEKRWSVQVSAVPERDVADRLAQQLIEKGYDGYIVQAEVKGQTYYRVRAGRFDAREEAESMRQSLAGEGSYRDAYVTSD
jgi:cell division protein FtsN